MLKTVMPRTVAARQGRGRAAFEWAASTLSRLAMRLKRDRTRRDARLRAVLEAVIHDQRGEGRL